MSEFPGSIVACGVSNGRVLCSRRPYHDDGHSWEQDVKSKDRPGDQPMPVPNDSPDIQSLVIEDIKTRREIGIKRYGTALQPGNQRDSLRDAYEECLDLACYLRQAIAERDDLGMPGFPR